MFDYTKVLFEVEDYLGEFVGDFDLDAIMVELSDYKPVDVELDHIRSVDDVDPDDFTDIIQRHDVSISKRFGFISAAY